MNVACLWKLVHQSFNNPSGFLFSEERNVAPWSSVHSWCDGSSDRSFIVDFIELFLVPASAPRLV